MKNEKFTIQGKIAFCHSVENYPDFVTLYGKESQCKIALHGAQVLSFIPKNAKDLLWLSTKATYEEGVAIRGGIPICFPWFASEAKPAHGFARLLEWEVVQSGVDEEGNPHIRFRLESTAKTKTMWDYDFCAELLVKVSKGLELQFIVENRDTKSFSITEALHTYFSVSNIADISVEGLEGKRYTDSLKDTINVQEGAIIVAEEIDRIYHDSPQTSVIVDRGYRRQIAISKENSNSTVVWNPWIDKSSSMKDFDEGGYEKMLCVESANVAQNAVRINPGEQHTMKVVIEAKTFTNNTQ